jgi:long-chain acyl-CoA synthetase
MFLQRVAKTPDGNAFAYPGTSGPEWLTWSAAHERASAIAAGLIALGVRPEDRVAIAASTTVKWVLCDLGIMCAGAATTTIYPTTEAKDATYILADSGSKVLIAEDTGQVEKLAGADLPDLTHIVMMDGSTPDAPVPVPVLSLAEVEQKGVAALAGDPELVTRVANSVRPDQMATLMYTSGTTGTPKGVELLQGGWAWEGVAQGELGLMLPHDLHYLWLPLSHSFGKTLMCGMIHVGLPTYVDGRIDKLVDNLATVRPTLMCGAPRIFEKVYNRVVTMTKDGGGLKWKIFQWAFAVGNEVYQLELVDKRPTGLLKMKHALADRLVFSKIRERLGGRIRILVSGSAPLSKDIAEFFHTAGLTILEGYGLTETSAAAFVNLPGLYKFGTVGMPLGDLEVRIAEDGEVELRGVPVMRGYHNLPEETSKIFTPDGYLRTGDIGELDAERYLTITDRKKDLIKTSGGKYIAPSHIEGLFKGICPYVSQVVVIGYSRNFCSMVLTLDPDAVTGWASGTALEGKSYEEIASSIEANEMIYGYVKELNSRLNRWETIKKFTILPRDLSIEEGELTPSLKIKRKAVEQHFADAIEAMYEGSIV